VLDVAKDTVEVKKGIYLGVSNRRATSHRWKKCTSMRAMNLSNALVRAGHRVLLRSLAVYHQEKRQRSFTTQTIKVSANLEIRQIASCAKTLFRGRC
jgi:hypothetical protein